MCDYFSALRLAQRQHKLPYLACLKTPQLSLIPNASHQLAKPPPAHSPPTKADTNSRGSISKAKNMAHEAVSHQFRLNLFLSVSIFQASGLIAS
jgi:hypothetical protein